MFMLFPVFNRQKRLVHSIVRQGLTARLPAAVLLGLLLIIPARGRADLVDRIAAVVNDDIILQSEVDAALAPWRQKMRQEGYSDVQLNLAVADQMPMVLDQLIDEKLADQQIKRDRISVEDAEVDAAIERIRQANKMSMEQMRRMLDLGGITFEKYRKQIKEQMLRTRLVNREVKSKIVLTDEDIRAYYEEHKSEYSGSTSYHLRHILIRVAQQAADDEREQARQKCRQILERLQAGGDFAELAKVWSQAPTASQGGDLGNFDEKLLAADIQKALKGLDSGQITDVIETDQGFQIFQVEEVIRRGGKKLDDARAEIQEKLFGRFVDQKYQSWLKELRKNAHIEVLN